MYKLLLKYTFTLASLNSALIILSRTLYKDAKVGLNIYLCSNIVNTVLSFKMSEKRRYFDKHVFVVNTWHTIASVGYFISVYMNLSSVTFNNYYSIKIPVVSLCSILIMRSHYACFQYVGKSLVLFGVFVQFLNDKNAKFSLAMFTALASGTANAISTVYFEWKLKKQLSSIYEYLFTYNLCNLPFTVACAVTESCIYDLSSAYMSFSFYMIILLNVLYQQASVHFSLHVDSFERTVISMGCNIVAALISDYVLKYPIQPMSIVSLCIITIGTTIYVAYKK